MSQLPLSLCLQERASFDNYFAGPNAHIVALLRDAVRRGGERSVYLWGGPGSGKTHLLHALAHEYSRGGRSPAYLCLGEAGDWTPAVLDGLEAAAAILVDDVQAAAGRHEWERAWFHLFNRALDSGTPIFMTANAAPAGVGVNLPDLCSRLAGGPVLHLKTLDDEEKAAALRGHAEARGLTLSQDVARYLLRHCPRNMGDLFAILEMLDRASLAAQRRLTVPFVKSVLEMRAHAEGRGSGASTSAGDSA
ncbi:MAG TPA: DnaA regulatory inactivator Hda [Gammaproteobacteria bacterium]|nr:DnaA regulatory inactivator Hda [Gammaproteobacteria bacterium]